jgi:hypothetical protein
MEEGRKEEERKGGRKGGEKEGGIKEETNKVPSLIHQVGQPLGS